MKVDLKTLEIALIKILAHAQNVKGAVIDLPEDLYWFIQNESLFDPARAPGDITLGSLDDDWEQLQQVARGERDPLGYDLIWASALLRCLGEHVE